MALLVTKIIKINDMNAEILIILIETSKIMTYLSIFGNLLPFYEIDDIECLVGRKKSYNLSM